MKKILSLILILSVMFMQISVMADTVTETESDVLEITLLPKDYAVIHITKTGYSEHSKYSKTLGVYYNTLYSMNVYAEFGSVITSYKVPFKDELTNMSISYNVTKGGMQSGRTIPVIYDFDKFSIDAEAGYYKGPVAATDTTEAIEATEEYAEILEYTNKYWPQNNKYGYSGKNLAHSILETETGAKNYDVTETAMAAYVDENNTSEYITFATGRETSEYANGSFSVATEEKIPTLTLKYSISEVLSKINSTSQENMPKLMEDIVDLGILKNTTMGAEAYKTLINSAKKYVDEKIYETIKNGGFADLESFYSAYDTHVEYAVTNGMILAINGVRTADEMGEMIDELGVAGSLESTSVGYEGYTRLNDGMKGYVNNALFKVVLNGGFADLKAICEEFDKAVIHVSEIPAKVKPENFATIHITRDGYADHTKYAKKLGAYYNTQYSGSVYAEFGSVISSFNIPFKNSIEDIGISYYVVKGGMQSGRTIPVFFDYNKFSVDADAGYHQGPVAATDTTDAIEATKGYKEILTYASKYWPASGYSYSKTALASNVAVNILETTTGTKTYDLTGTVLDGFIKSESDYVTFSTGRETSEYANGAIDASNDEKMPKLIITYDAVKVLDDINNTAENDTVEMIDNLGKSGILENGEQGYAEFENLSDANKKRAAGIIYDVIKNGGYKTFDEFIDSYDYAVINSETVITDIKISDSEKEYETAKDAAGKQVTVTATVKFAEKSGTYKAIFAEYSEGKLLSVVSKDLPYNASEVEFTKTLSKDITDAKVIIMDSLSGMKPIAKSVNDRLGVLDGKKVIFIGNSHTYRGMTVVEKDLDILDQESRSNDTGYFYQLCKANGWDVEVTNWTFSGHGLMQIFGGNPCTYNSSCNGKIHENYLTDRYFDYVFIQSARGSTTSEEKFISDVTYIMNIFKEVNPNVKFVILGTLSTHGHNQTDTPAPAVLASYKKLEKQGLIIADWGEVIAGILEERYTVSNAKQEYLRSSFIVSDNYHLNALGGYLTTLTAYCAVTGEPAVGQSYAFYNDTSLNSKFNISNYTNKYYTNGTADTNFHLIFQSESDMKGLQQLVDKVLKEKAYREY